MGRAIEDISDWICAWVVDALRIEPASVDTRGRLFDLGLGSVLGVQLTAALAAKLGRPVSPTLLWEHATIAELAAHLGGGAAPTPTSAQPPRAAGPEPVAIVGMACRFPKAADLEAFWRLLADGVDATDRAPADRWDAARYHDSDPGSPGKSVTDRGAFLADVRGFEPLFFGISPREADELDPQQRLALELAWEALEHAGVPPRGLAGSRTGVYLGSMWHDWADLSHADLAGMSAHRATGTANNLIANRVSYVLGLRGPSLVVDTACSSALVAIHLGCQALALGDAELVLAGAVNLMLAPESSVFCSKFGGLAPDGRCKTFDAAADGFARGEGGGVVVLKPLSRALADGDRVLAVLRGTAVNNDGASQGLTAPNPRAQEEVLRAALARAGRAGAQVHYVEAHGTGTLLGDPIEAGALGAVLGVGRPDDRPLALGSVKTNIGHTEAAAGIAGVIKAVLAMQHRALPPSLHLQRPNPHIPFDALHLRVPTTLEPWPAPLDAPALAGVSAFGWGGTNAHVVLEAAPPAPRWFGLAARSEAELATRLRALSGARDLERIVEIGEGPHRAALVARSTFELRAQIDAALHGRACDGLARGEAGSPRIVFVCSPLGSQWLGMARQLLQEPVFRAAIGRCDRAFAPLLGRSIVDDLRGAWTHVDEVVRVQPLLFAVQVGLAALLDAWGVVPAAIVGHSAGEIAAAHIAGALDLEQAAQVVHHYARVQRPGAGEGAMAVVALPAAALAEWLAPQHGQVVVAARNSAASTVISGAAPQVAAVLAGLQAVGVTCSPIRTDVAGHSPMVAAGLAELATALADLRPAIPTIPLHSSVGGPDELVDGRYWARNLGQPVRFHEAIAGLLAGGHDTFIELGPHPVVSHAIQQICEQHQVAARVLPTLRRASDERLSLLTTRAALFVAGASEPATTAVATSSSTTTTSIGTTSVGTTSVGTTSIGTTSVGTTSVGTTSVVAGSVTSTEVVPTARPRSEPAQLLLLSARSEAALAASRDAMADWIEQRDLPVADLCFTAALRRSHLEHRLAVVGASRPALAAALRHAGTGTRIGARPRIVFVFPGQGSQWPGMGRTLLATEPVFRARFEACAAALAPYLHPDPSGPNFAGPSLAELVTDADASLERSDIVQPLLWAFGVALAALWRELGVTPDAVVGHSMGEVAAACVAGALSLDDGARIIALRSRLARSLVAERGAMAVVELSLADAGRAIADLSPRVVVGVHNGPRSCVLSGEPAALDLVLARLEARGVFCRRVRVDYASHSPQMHALTGPLLAALAGIAPRSGEVPMLSTLSADWQPGAGLDPAYWAANIRERVRFAEAVDRLQRSAPDEPTRSWQGQPRVLLEVSPHPVLLAAMRDGLPTTGGHLALGSLRRDEDPRACLLEALGALHTLGAEARLSSLFPDGGRPIDLPAIAWQRSPHWLPKPAAAPAPIGGHPLLGAGFSSPAQPGTHFFAGTLSSQRPPYLTDHRVGDAIVVPGATWLDLVLAAARQAELPTDTITDARFEAALVLPESGDVAVQVVLTRGDDGPRFECFARAAESWTRHVSGRLQHAPSQPGSAPTATPHPGAALTTATPHPTAALTTAAPRPGAAFYAELAARGLHYGPRCRGVESLAVVDHRVFATLVRPEGSNAPGSVLHPVLLDAALHALVALVPAADARPLVPVGLRRSHLHRAPGASACALARIVAQDGERIEGEVQILDPDGELLVEIDGLQLQRLAGARARHDDRLTLAWRELPAITPTRGPARWLLLPDRGGVATRLQTLLESTGDHVERATDLDALTGTWDGLLDLSGLDLTLAPEAAGEATSRATIDVLDPMLRRAQALSRQPGPELPRLWLLTRGARRVLADDPVIPTQAPIWGLGLTLGYEHPELRCTRVDLPTDDPALTASLHALVTELHADPGEDQLALRGPRRLGARILTGTNTTASHVHPNKTASPTPTSHSDHPNTGTHTRPTSTAHPSPGAHLITGGLGGLGLALAQWWVARGARHLVLLGRRGVTEPTQAATLAELRAAGARIDIHSVDVADADALARVLADLDVPLLGVFHAAGVLDDGLVRNQDRRGLERVMAPKIAGAWNLHRLTRDQPLRHFVLYSSVAALIGSPGQSNYAAANAFLDALAEHRHALGLPALSVAWGAIADVGLAAQDEQRGARLAGRGILPLSVARAHEQLALLLDSPAHIHVGIAAFDPRAWLEFYPTAAASPLFTELRAPSPTTSQSLRAELTAASPDERARLVDDFLRAQVLRVLRVDATRLHRHVSLLELGLDSLTGLELRNRLEAGLGLPLRASLAWTYPRLDELAAHLTELVTPAPPPSLIAPTPTPPEADPDALEQLSDDELMRALAAELERTP